MQFRPFIALSLVFVPLLMLFVWLGLWQMDRMHAKQDLIDKFEQAAEMNLKQAITEDKLFARVLVSGRYELSWHLLLDNKILDGRVGVHALTLFRPDEGLPLLVNRGWLPLGPSRSSLPEIPTPSGVVNIAGILIQPLNDGLRLGEPDNLQSLNGAKLITYLDVAALRTALNEELSPWMIQLNADEETGFNGREWLPTVIMPAQHAAYAVQWFGLGVAAAVIWITLLWKWNHQVNRDGDSALLAPDGDES